MLKNISFLTIVLLFFSGCVVNKRYHKNCLKGSFIRGVLVEGSSTFDLPIPALIVKNRGKLMYPERNGDETLLKVSNELIFSREGKWEVTNDTVKFTFTSLPDEGPYLFVLSSFCDTLLPLSGNPYSNSYFIRAESTLNKTKN